MLNKNSLNTIFKSKTVVLSLAYSLALGLSLSSCGNNTGTTRQDNNTNLSSNLVIERAGEVPVLDGNATQTGVYVHNNSSTKISGIRYSVAANGITESNNNLSLSSGSCNEIAANSSCLLSFTTPSLSLDTQGSSLIIAQYNDKQSKQLISYRYVNSKGYTGVNFSDNSQRLFGGNDYATSYVFVGQGGSATGVKFITSNPSVGISSGLTNGKLNLLTNQVVAIELNSSRNVTQGLVTITPLISSTKTQQMATSKQLNTTSATNSLQVVITPQMQANLLMSNLPLLTPNAKTATLTLLNNGNQAASITGMSSGSPSDVSVAVGSNNSCSNGMTLEVGASCNYLVSLANTSSNGSAVLTLTYNSGVAPDLGGGILSATQTAYYQNQMGAPMLQLVPTQTNFTEAINTNGYVTFNFTNLGSAPLTSVVKAVQSTLTSAPAPTVAIINDTCDTTIAGGANCSVMLNITAQGLAQNGIIYLKVIGNDSTSRSYSFVSRPIAISITDNQNPSVSGTFPQNTSTAVNKTTGISVSFSEPMKAITLNSDNIWLVDNGNNGQPISLSFRDVTPNNQTVNFTTAGQLVDTTNYSIMINSSQVQDINGNAIGDSPSQVASFTTSDSSAPTIISVQPSNNSSNVSRQPSISLQFSEAMNPTTLTTGNIMLKTQAGTTVAGTSIAVSSDKTTVTVNLNAINLVSTTTYQLVLNQVNIKDVAGNSLGTNPTFLITQFTTGDLIAPTLSSTIPLNGATLVAVESPISLRFSETMNTSTLTTSTVQLQKVSNSSYVTLNAPSFSNNNQTVTFQPNANLATGESYNIVINSSAIKDVAGNAMGTGTQTRISSFRTVAPVVGTINLPQTGQTPTLPITATSGMDGFTYKGVPWAYVTSGATTPATRFTVGTGAAANCITDNLTGLMWPRNGIIGFESTDGGGPIAQPNYANTTANLNSLTWAQALTAVSKMNSAPIKLCGYADWYLPTVNDLKSLLNDGQASSATWLNAPARGFSNVQAYIYWSSSTYARDPTYVWAIIFNDGSVSTSPKNYLFYVWPVRLGQ